MNETVIMFLEETNSPLTRIRFPFHEVSSLRRNSSNMCTLVLREVFLYPRTFLLTSSSVFTSFCFSSYTRISSISSLETMMFKLTMSYVGFQYPDLELFSVPVSKFLNFQVIMLAQKSNSFFRLKIVLMKVLTLFWLLFS